MTLRWIVFCGGLGLWIGAVFLFYVSVNAEPGTSDVVNLGVASIIAATLGTACIASSRSEGKNP
jgi:hypothetical protein